MAAKGITGVTVMTVMMVMTVTLAGLLLFQDVGKITPSLIGRLQLSVMPLDIQEGEGLETQFSNKGQWDFSVVPIAWDL